MIVSNAGYLGDIAAGAVVDFKFTTVDSTFPPFSLSGGAISVYKDNSTTQSTAGVTLTADFDSVTGLNHVRITTVTDGSFYAAGSNFDVVITAGTVNGVSANGYTVASFSIDNRGILRPTVATRTLDVTATGAAGIDWGNVENPTTTVGLSGTTVKTATDVETDTADIQTRLPAALTAGGNIKADALALSGDTVAADNAESFFDGTGYAGTNNVIPLVTTTTTATTATNVTTVNGLAANVITAASIATDAIGSAELSAAAIAKIADAVLRRQCDNAEASSDGDTLDLSSLYGLIQQAQESAISGATLTVKKTDGSTTLGTKAVTVDATTGNITAIS